MKGLYVTVLLAVCCIVGCLAPSVNLWEAAVVPCNLDICGGYPANIATLQLKHGTVTVDKNGRILIELQQIRYIDTQEKAANKTFDMYFGSFSHLANETSFLGTITTDAEGNFRGEISTGEGIPYALAQGTTLSGQFIFNDPQVRSELITGFTVPIEDH